MELPNEVFIEDLIFLAYRGSVAHNMYIPNSDPNSVDDIDLMGVFIAPDSHYIGIDKSKQTVEKNIEADGVLYDCVYYELSHFVRLLLKNNPNVLSMLWLRKEHYITMSEGFSLLLDFRKIFSSKAAYHSFTGYAYSQLNRMEKYDKNGYMGEKRKRLVEKYGYDCKNAAHLIRLLRMGVEFLETGKMEVFRSDAKELIEIKTGKWSLEEVKICAEKLFEQAKVARDGSVLPELPDRNMANKIVESIIYRKIMERWDSYTSKTEK
jgi:predicted nucleotidyltransferase